MPGGVSGELRSGADAQFVEDVDQVGLHCGPGDEEPLGDLGVGEALGEQLHDSRFGGGQAGPAAGRAATLAAGSGRVPHRFVDAEQLSFGPGGGEAGLVKLRAGGLQVSVVNGLVSWPACQADLRP